jgi:hypothetical protein
MPSRNEQQQIRWRDAFGEAHRERMRLEVVHGDERQPARQRNRLSGDGADDQSADQSRPRCRGHGGEIIEARVCLAHRLAYEDIEAFDMRPGGDLRHYAAERPVALPL